MRTAISALALALALCLLAWSTPARALVTPEEAKKLGASSGSQPAAAGQPSAPAAGTIRTPDGTVITVPKAATPKDAPGGSKVQERKP